jgi:hypothetical protein
MKKYIFIILFIIMSFNIFAVGISTVIIKEKKPYYNLDVKLPYFTGPFHLDKINQNILKNLEKMERQIGTDSLNNFSELTDSEKVQVTLKGEYTIKINDFKSVSVIIKNRYILNGYDVQIDTYTYSLSPVDDRFYSREDIFLNTEDGIFQVKKIIENEVLKQLHNTKMGESTNVYHNKIIVDTDSAICYLDGKNLVLELIVKGAPPYYDGWSKFTIPKKNIEGYLKKDMENWQY